MADLAQPLAAPVPWLGRLAETLAGLRGWRRQAAAFGLGALAVLAMPPAGAVPVLFIAFPGLLWLLEGVQTRRGAFALGWFFSFGFFVCGLYWVAWALTVDLARYGWLMPFAVAGLPALLAVFPGLATLASFVTIRRFGLGRLAAILAFAAWFGLGEWLRGWVLTGFPWNLMGYAWTPWTAVLQSVSVIGIYGLTLLTVLVAALPAALPAQPGGGGARWSRPALAALAAGLAGFALIGAAGALRLAGAADAVVPGVVLRLVQPNTSQLEKWDRQFFDRHIQRLETLSQGEPAADGSGAPPPTAIIWSETAFPGVLEDHPDYLRNFTRLIPPGGYLLTGALRASGRPPADGRDTRAFWNSLDAVNDAGQVVGHFDKSHLVPFGEYMPWPVDLIMDRIAPGLGRLSAGPGPRTLSLPGLPPFSPLICYEVLFPGHVIDPANRPAWLLNITNDGWYGETAGPHQHFAIARTRAVEEGLPLVRVAMTGISGVVDPYGRVTERIELGVAGMRDARLPEALPPTLYARWRDAPFLATLLVFLAASVLMRPRRRTRQ